MYSQAYGTPPLVSPTGGLVDSVTDATADPANGTGFIMKSADGAGFQEALQRAARAFRKPGEWRRIQLNGMARSFSWEESAQRYVDVYEQAIHRARS